MKGRYKQKRLQKAKQETAVCLVCPHTANRHPAGCHLLEKNKLSGCLDCDAAITELYTQRIIGP